MYPLHLDPDYRPNTSETRFIHVIAFENSMNGVQKATQPMWVSVSAVQQNSRERSVVSTRLKCNSILYTVETNTRLYMMTCLLRCTPIYSQLEPDISLF